MPGDDPHATDVFTGHALHVQVASPRYLLAMKLLSARPERDYDDAVRLAALAGVASHDELLNVLQEHYPASAIPTKCRYFALDVATARSADTSATTEEGPWDPLSPTAGPDLAL